MALRCHAQGLDMASGGWINIATKSPEIDDWIAAGLVCSLPGP